jgi:hypothetical protein
MGEVNRQRFRSPLPPAGEGLRIAPRNLNLRPSLVYKRKRTPEIIGDPQWDLLSFSLLQD